MLALLLYTAYFFDEMAKEIAEKMRSSMTIEERNMWLDIHLKTLELRHTILSYLIPTYYTYEVITGDVYTYRLPFLHYVSDSFDLKVLCEGEPPLWLPFKDHNNPNQLNHWNGLDFTKYTLDDIILQCAYTYNTLAMEAAKDIREYVSYDDDDDWDYESTQYYSYYCNSRDSLLSMLKPSYYTVDKIDCGAVTFGIPFYHYESEGIHLAVPAVDNLDFYVPFRPSRGILGLMPSIGGENQEIPESVCDAICKILRFLRKWGKRDEDT